ncbi:hypothetical protein LEAN103870_02720 [Legionella anisa]|uniref:23, 7 kDa protein n=1 Tax=Legionella anisa TaxID=28082 RepID=A0AAX0WTY0_9GAMM|nr:hypothetical protein [Legionella anisa]AWN74355.1 hypothetical protein DLD14_11130 [Legionella anisa]KTC71965.1 23, 7 kDa protein [Legionella anisa]MBN5935237.1 hypothetical protein [Legionella anisa]MCW8425547.1 hypothetical protein [Legionella anisa]MCW8449022.1 hypothetical protein [Legionella anisa]
MPFFSKKYTHKSALDKIKEAKNLLAHIEQEKKFAFFEMLQLRIDEFELALKGDVDSSETQSILEQYNQFAKTVHLCLSHPKLTGFYISSYHNQKYYPVGISEVIEEPVRHKISLAATILGAALILTSLIAFPFNPLISAILLPIGISLLAPAVASLLTPDPFNTAPKKLEEKMLFQAGAKLIDPSLSFDEPQEYEGRLQANLT